MAVNPALLFTPTAMAKVDAAAIKAGTAGSDLMERAGQAVARLVLSLKGRGLARIFCGPGNNGGDGWVAARHLRAAGWSVDVWSSVDPATLHGDAAWAASCWKHGYRLMADLPEDLGHCDVFIDAVFGAGLARPLEVEVSKALKSAMQCAETSIAIDVPSGVNGSTGEDVSGFYQERSPHFAFDHCVTFGALKFGHVLLPGKLVCGNVWIADIGLGEEDLLRFAAGVPNHPYDVAAHPGLSPQARYHKYNRGHVAVIAGGADKMGAGLLAAEASLGVGAGLVTIFRRDLAATPKLHALMTAPWPKPADVSDVFQSKKISCCLIGPGLGLDGEAALLLEAALEAGVPLVLDADALTLIAKQNWLSKLTANMIVTPHEGEFGRLFPDVGGAKINRFHAALGLSKSLICLKGADTLIGQMDAQQVAVNVSGPAQLATAGSGDVLAGCIAGLLAPGVDPYDAARIGVSLHSFAGQQCAAPLVADHLISALPDAIAAYKKATH